MTQPDGGISLQTITVEASTYLHPFRSTSNHLLCVALRRPRTVLAAKWTSPLISQPFPACLMSWVMTFLYHICKMDVTGHAGRSQLSCTPCVFPGAGPSKANMDAWVRDYDDAKQLADDTLALIQARLPASWQC